MFSLTDDQREICGNGDVALFSLPFPGLVRINLPSELRPSDAVFGEGVFFGSAVSLVTVRRIEKELATTGLVGDCVGVGVSSGRLTGVCVGKGFLLEAGETATGWDGETIGLVRAQFIPVSETKLLRSGDRR
jgi:hypothetical protein